MMPSSIFQPALAGLREGPSPRAGTVQPVKSLPLKSGFHGSADCSDARSTKQSSVTMPKEMFFIGILPPWNSEDVERGILIGICFLTRCGSFGASTVPDRNLPGGALYSLEK